MSLTIAGQTSRAVDAIKLTGVALYVVVVGPLWLLYMLLYALAQAATAKHFPYANSLIHYVVNFKGLRRDPLKVFHKKALADAREHRRDRLHDMNMKLATMTYSLRPTYVNRVRMAWLAADIRKLRRKVAQY